MPHTILYLHGFRSGPQSAKAETMRRECAARDMRFICPQLPDAPARAVELVRQLASQSPPGELAVIGSSLGGFFATWLAERIACRAVLINPAVDPARDLAGYAAGDAGPLRRFHSDELLTLPADYLEQLRALYTGELKDTTRYLLLAATGDELLDWREMAAHYAGAAQRIVPGSDHGFSDFGSYVDTVFAFIRGEAVGDVLPDSAQRVQRALDALALRTRVIVLQAAVKTAQQAADALKVQVGQIAKSLMFRGRQSNGAILVICAGDRRVDERLLGTLVGEPVERATPQFVREHAGYAIGGVPPLGHVSPVKTLFDASLQRFDEVWAAGGTPETVFPCSPLQLAEALGLQLQDVTTTAVLSN
jgi:uncharacterized protein